MWGRSLGTLIKCAKGILIMPSCIKNFRNNLFSVWRKPRLQLLGNDLLFQDSLPCKITEVFYLVWKWCLVLWQIHIFAFLMNFVAAKSDVMVNITMYGKIYYWSQILITWITNICDEKRYQRLNRVTGNVSRQLTWNIRGLKTKN